MDIVRKARQVESGIARTLERAAQQWAKSGAREPLEIVQAIVAHVADRLEPAGRGKYVFPFNAIEVSIVAGSREARARFAAVLESEPTLRDRIAARLRDAGCASAALQIGVSYVTAPAYQWTAADFHVEFARVAAPQVPVAQPVAPCDLTITILHGNAEKPEYVLALPRVNLGRCGEVRDRLNRLIRTNHVAFTDAAGAANETVSRGHAHIEFIESSSGYRLADDRSAHGTSVIRHGRTIVVPAGSRGVRLESGDEIVLGEARARVRIGAAE